MEFTVNQIETPLPVPKITRNLQTSLNLPSLPLTAPSATQSQQSSTLNKSTRFFYNQTKSKQPSLPSVPENHVNYNLNQAQVKEQPQQKLPSTPSQPSSSAVENYINFISYQDFEQIKRTHSLSNRFIDTAFRVSNDSVFFTQKLGEYLREKCKYGGCENKPIQIQWKRAKDLHPMSHFLLDKNNQPVNLNKITESNYLEFFKTKDYEQGLLENNWFISAVTGIVQNYDLLRRVVPFDNSFDDSNYCGAFHFRFWVYGEWKDVVVDDFLPVGPDNQLIFSKNRFSSNELWCALLEKAYAKIYGSYEALENGYTVDALIDMSGGIREHFDLKEIKKSLTNSSQTPAFINYDAFWNLLYKAREQKSAVNCKIQISARYQKGFQLKNGLFVGHVYTSTKMAEIPVNNTVYRLIRLYKPWGSEPEWNGKWSESSEEWKLVEKHIKDKLEIKNENNGEFWMDFKDWISNFDECFLCNLTPNFKVEPSGLPKSISSIFSIWQSDIFHDRWVFGLTAGGRKEPKFWKNPQIVFTINKNNLINGNSTCPVIITFMQKYSRFINSVNSIDQSVNFTVCKVIGGFERYKKYFEQSKPINKSDLELIGMSGAYLNQREVIGKFTLSAGTYVVIPSRYEADTEGEFLVRILTQVF